MDHNKASTYEEEVTEEPVDYSKKYTERDIRLDGRHQERDVSVQESQVRVAGSRSKKEFGEREAKVDLFGDYAETDLDQPTDYSLRYAEDDTDDEEKENPHEYFPGSVQEDTVKTYCTEGTPYETPFNFSTATSMSDLRLEDSKESMIDPPKKPSKKAFEVAQKDATDTVFKRSPVAQSGAVTTIQSNLRHKDVPVTHLQLAKTTGTSKNSGPPLEPDCESLGDEKVNRYYDSTTPDAFPRVNSLSSLGGTMTQQNTSETSSKTPSEDGAKPVPSTEINNTVASQSNLNSETLETPSETDSSIEPKANARVIDKEGKVVTFGGEDFYAEQTPLMFSRCSSLGSLSGFEQHSIHDDRSSIVSDFSRRTSGIVSPSELPDSPTQTVPPSPRNRKTTEFISKNPEEAVRPPVRHLSYSKAHPPRTSVFEDDIATFKEESTPIEFSTATSLSSLTIDDEAKTPHTNNKTQARHENVPSNIAKENLHEERRELPREKVTYAEKACQAGAEKDQEQVSDADEGDDDDEDMLAACISMGMQNNRYRQSFKTAGVMKQPVKVEAPNVLVRYPRNSQLNRLESRVSANAVENSTAAASKTTKPPMETVAAPDTVHVYCTEDTPADISPVGSQSNLSALSMPSVQEDVERIKEEKSSSELECHRNDLSDESSNLSGEDEKILDECIQSGMPKVRQMTPPPANCIPFSPKAEIVPARFNICGTPSSSPVESGHSSKNTSHVKPLCRTAIEPENDFSDDSLNHSDDEAILTECIRSAMPKVRLNMSSLTNLPSTQNLEKSKPSTSHNRKSPASGAYYPSRYREQMKEPVRRSEVPFVDRICLSEDEQEEEDEDIMLAQCIRSGIPRALNVSSTSPSSVTARKIDHYHESRTCVNRNVATQVEYPNTHKQQASSMDMSSNYHRFTSKQSDRNKYAPRSVTRSGRFVMEKTNLSTAAGSSSGCTSRYLLPGTLSNGCSSSRSHVASCTPTILNRTENYEVEEPRNIVKSTSAPSRHSSVSSLSEEGSLGSIEEWALLELCINSGIPRSRCRLKGGKVNEAAICASHEERETISGDNYSMCSYNSYVCKT